MAQVPGKRVALTAARLRKCLTVEDLASRVGVSKWCCYKIEEGSRDPSHRLMGAMARELDSTVDVLFFAPVLDDGSTREASAL